MLESFWKNSNQTLLAAQLRSEAEAEKEKEEREKRGVVKRIVGYFLDKDEASDRAVGCRAFIHYFTETDVCFVAESYR
jgi:hypothetical protein